MHKLIEYVCDELKELEKKSEKGNLSMSDIQYADTLAHMKKNLLKGEELYEEMEGEYSNARDGMGYSRSYARGRSSRAQRDSRGRYSRDEGYSYADESMDDLLGEMRSLMRDMPEEKRREVQRFVDKMEHM